MSSPTQTNDASSRTTAAAAPATIPLPASSEIPVHKKLHRWPMILIGIGKLFKSAGLITLAILFHYVPAWHDRLAEYVNWAREDPHNHYLYRGIEKIIAVPEHSLRLLALGLYIYATLYGIEGVGLLLNKKWAEWMVIVTTGGFLPIEIYEIFKEVTTPKIVLFVLNVIVLIYLIFRVRRQMLNKHAHAVAAPVSIPSK